MSSISGYSSSYSSYSGYSSQVRQQPTEEEMAAMKKAMYSKADSDGSGGISKTELADFLSNGPGGDTIDTDSTFTSFDTDGDGSISEDEMDKGMQSLKSQMESNMGKARFGGDQQGMGGMKEPPSLSELFSKADSDSSSGISSDEFADFISKGPQANQINAEEAFAKYDTNGDGTMTSDEFEAGMKDMMASMPLPPKPSGESSSDSSSSSKNIMSALDTDGDGTISEEELTGGLSSKKIQEMISAYVKQMSSSYSSSSSTDSILSSLTA
ncbi:MAG: EF-hand domain-containing protein [Campylobacterales bacterium]|nr:EF-hand domain-containing protein [Campylobacterales bacterium]